MLYRDRSYIISLFHSAASAQASALVPNCDVVGENGRNLSQSFIQDIMQSSDADWIANPTPLSSASECVPSTTHSVAKSPQSSPGRESPPPLAKRPRLVSPPLPSTLKFPMVKRIGRARGSVKTNVM